MFVVINKVLFQHIIDTKLFINYFTFFKKIPTLDMHDQWWTCSSNQPLKKIQGVG